MNEQPQFDEAAATEVGSFGEVSHALSRVATCMCFFFIIFFTICIDSYCIVKCIRTSFAVWNIIVKQLVVVTTFLLSGIM